MRMCTCVGVYACACARVWECMHAVLSGATRYWWSTCMHTGVGCMHAHVHACGGVCMHVLSGATRYWWSTCMHAGVECMHVHVHACGGVCMPC